MNSLGLWVHLNRNLLVDRLLAAAASVCLRWLVFDPWPLCQTQVHLKVRSEHEILSFSVRKEMIKNDNSLVVILLSKVVENGFLQTLQPIHKVESSYCHYLDMLKLQTNERNNVYISFARRDSRKLTCLTVKFQEEAIEPLPEIAWWIHGVWRTFQFWSSEEMLANKLGVDILLLLCRLRFCKSFHSDNYVYYDLNNRTLDFLT